MLIRYASRLLGTIATSLVPKRLTHAGVLPGKDKPESDERFVEFLNKIDIDGWEVRKALCELHGMDQVPSPPVIKAALRACRRINDYSLAVRMLESIKFKCGNHVKTIWPYVVNEIEPTLKELGVDLPEKLGYDKPELWKDDNEGVW